MAPLRLLAPVAAFAALACAAPAAAGAAGPVSSHAMVHTCCMPLALKERVFAESKALGARYIRVDFELNAIFESFGRAALAPDWRRFDEVMELSRRYDLPVLGIVLGTPNHISACPERWPDSGRCATIDPAEYGRLAGELAARGHGVADHWEIVNEPDGRWAFEGEPEEYARMLSASYDAIKARAPGATVAMGGVMDPWSPAWVERVLAAGAAGKFDIANVHLRGHAGGMGPDVERWRALMARHGFGGPLWVTEHGYPGDTAAQTDPRFTGGEPAQAIYLERSLLGMAEAGAEQIFVTLYDPPDPAYASEGLVEIGAQQPFASRRKPAFDAVRRFGERWSQVPGWRAHQRRAERRAEDLQAAVLAGEARMRALRRSHAAFLAALRKQLRPGRARAAAKARARTRRVRRLRKHLRWLRRELHIQEDRTAGRRSDVAEALGEGERYRRLIEG